MITSNLTEAALDELHKEASNNSCPRARRKCWVVYLREKGYACRETADVERVDANTVTEYVRKYRDGGLPGLFAEDYRLPGGCLDGHAEQLKDLFRKRPPHTVNQAIEMIKQETGVFLQPSACRKFLHKLGLKPRRCGLVPGKALEDTEQQREQQDFHDRKLQPLLEEAEQGRRVVLFVDAAHFVMGAFLGMLWCFARQLLPSSSGRQRLTQRKQVFGIPGAAQGFTHPLSLLFLNLNIAQLQQTLRVALPGQKGTDHFQATHAGQRTDDIGKLDVHPLHRLLQVLDMTGSHGNVVLPQAQILIVPKVFALPTRNL